MASDDEAPPSLLDNEARGGDTAEGGFSFQENLVVARVPRWLRREGFAQMIREAMGDAEAQFFVPGPQAAREFVEYKNHQVAPSEFWAEVARFQTLDRAAPGTYEQFVLVCKGMSPGLQPLLSAMRRVRDALPFYEGSTIEDASYLQFVAVVKSAERTSDDAAFVFRRVAVERDAPDAEALGAEVFRAALTKHFPKCVGLSGQQIQAAYDALRGLVKARKNKPISRAELEDALWGRMPGEFRPDLRPVRLVTTAESRERHTGPDLFVRCRGGGGGDGGRSCPPPETWEEMRSELEATREWIIEAGRSRVLSLGGSRALSTSVCIGRVFSAVAGFSIAMDYREETWRTTQYGGPDYSWDIETVAGGPITEFSVAIGIVRDIRTDVSQFVARGSGAAPLRLVLRGDRPVTGAESVNAAVSGAKNAIARELSVARARVVHLFIAGPSAFALFLGHRMNAIGDVQCYEWAGADGYAPTVRLST